MASSILLELMNCAWAVLGIWLFLVMANYVWTNWGQWDRPSVQLAKALSVYFLGESLVRFWVWWARAALRDGADISWMFTSHAPLLTFAGIATAGALCTIRVISPKEFGVWRWLLPVTCAIIVMAWSYFGKQG